MQSLLNASKAWQNIPAGSLRKREPSRRDPKNISLVTEADDPKTSSAVKPRGWNHKKINVENEQRKTEQLLNQTFSQKIVKQKSSKIQ